MLLIKIKIINFANIQRIKILALNKYLEFVFHECRVFGREGGIKMLAYIEKRTLGWKEKNVNWNFSLFFVRILGCSFMFKCSRVFHYEMMHPLSFFGSLSDIGYSFSFTCGSSSDFIDSFFCCVLTTPVFGTVNF